MTDLPAPRATRLQAPSWLDGRLIAGVLLVLISVVVGAKVVASADQYDTVWAAGHDLAPGTVVARGDLQAVKVRFHDHGNVYFSATGSVVGRTTTMPLSAGQLIPTAALPAQPPVAARLVTVPVDRLHMPRGNDLKGMQVDLYVTVKSAAGDATAPQLVLANVTIVDTVADSSLAGSGGSGVVLSVPIAYVDSVVAAAESGSIDLVRVPGSGIAAAPSPGSFTPGTVSTGSAAQRTAASASSQSS